MPPKPDDAKPKPEKPKKPTLPPDEYDEMDITQLQNELRKSTQKLNETRRVRNYFQLEKVCWCGHISLTSRSCATMLLSLLSTFSTMPQILTLYPYLFLSLGSNSTIL